MEEQAWDKSCVPSRTTMQSSVYVRSNVDEPLINVAVQTVYVNAGAVPKAVRSFQCLKRLGNESQSLVLPTTLRGIIAHH
jgi:hypothetical protein